MRLDAGVILEPFDQVARPAIGPVGAVPRSPFRGRAAKDLSARPGLFVHDRDRQSGPGCGKRGGHTRRAGPDDDKIAHHDPSCVLTSIPSRTSVRQARTSGCPSTRTAKSKRVPMLQNGRRG